MRPSAGGGLSVRFWGVRGSVPSPGPDTAKYGGNTPCIEVRMGAELTIFDVGTGVRALGDAANGPLTGTIFISHYHYDHLQGLPFFNPMFDPRSRFTIRGPTREGRTVQTIIERQMQQPFFPVTADVVFRAQLDYEPFAAGDRVSVGNGVVTALETNHPGGNLAYRVDVGDKAFVYATDTEHGTARDDALIEFARGADVLVYDAMYTDDEYAGVYGNPKAGWGHSTWQTAVKVADEAEASTLVLFHHEPTRTDASLDALMKQVRKARKQTVAAREGLRLTL